MHEACEDMIEVKIKFDSVTYNRFKRVADLFDQSVEEYILAWAMSGLKGDEDDNPVSDSELTW